MKYKYDTYFDSHTLDVPQSEGGSQPTTPGTEQSLSRNTSFPEPKPEWMNSMREDTFKEYKIDTITREVSKKNKHVNGANDFSSAKDSAIVSEHGNGDIRYNDY